MMRTALNYFLVFAIAADARTLSCFEYMKSISEQDHTTISENKLQSARPSAQLLKSIDRKQNDKKECTKKIYDIFFCVKVCALMEGEKCKTKLNPGDEICDTNLDCIEGICTSIDSMIGEIEDDYFDEYEDDILDEDDEESAEIIVLF